jgi:hypothetical protein
MTSQVGDAYTLERLRPAQREGALRLLRACFPGWPSKHAVDPAAHLAWKMSTSPDIANHHIVALAAGEVVGLRIGMAQVANVYGQTVLLHQGTDSAVHPAHRGHGLMGKIRALQLEIARRDFDLQLMGQTLNPAMVTLRTRQGYHKFANRVEVFRYRSGNTVGRRHVPISSLPRFDERVDELWRAASPQFDLAIARTAGYLNWRYCDPRGGDFTVRATEEHGQLTGFAALCVRGKNGYVADLLALPGRDDVLVSLLTDACANLVIAGALRIDCWTAQRHPYRAALLAAGFARQKAHKEFGYLPLRASAGSLAALAGKDAIIHLMAGDVDWI